ncbi:hypothetical protein PanWU01x14_133220 [Parasponia andersonii]|uniref:Uncharacterized protein n=1 Tax=Parasponia andersonii TaxID=3476 RepID=A0A2P5CQA4_PARAD|nr:hypothetical protein PanWU01x14_133220 [Parasponia andersonii]
MALISCFIDLIDGLGSESNVVYECKRFMRSGDKNGWALLGEMSKEDCVDSSFEVEDSDLNELNEEDDDVIEVGSESNAKVKKKTLKSKVWKFFDILLLGPDKKLRSKSKSSWWVVSKSDLWVMSKSGSIVFVGHVVLTRNPSKSC